MLRSTLSTAVLLCPPPRFMYFNLVICVLLSPPISVDGSKNVQVTETQGSQFYHYHFGLISGVPENPRPDALEKLRLVCLPLSICFSQCLLVCLKPFLHKYLRFLHLGVLRKYWFYTVDLLRFHNVTWCIFRCLLGYFPVSSKNCFFTFPF